MGNPAEDSSAASPGCGCSLLGRILAGSRRRRPLCCSSPLVHLQSNCRLIGLATNYAMLVRKGGACLGSNTLAIVRVRLLRYKNQWATRQRTPPLRLRAADAPSSVASSLGAAGGAPSAVRVPLCTSNRIAGSSALQRTTPCWCERGELALVLIASQSSESDCSGIRTNGQPGRGLLRCVSGLRMLPPRSHPRWEPPAAPPLLFALWFSGPLVLRSSGSVTYSPEHAVCP